MGNILSELADYARLRVASDKKRIPLKMLRDETEKMISLGEAREAFIFENTLRQDGLSFICEVKKASPSKGIIDEEFKYRDIARAYEAAGADCISCLTEPKWFLGSDEIFKDIRALVKTPMIRKDFTVDEYQIYQAKLMGADAVLLICSLLDERELKKYLRLCDEFGLSALTETHDAEELKLAVSCGARMIGVNNRNLRTFDVDIENSRRLKELAPDDVIFVSESGIRDVSDIPPLRSAGVDAVLIGEALMRATDKAATLKAFRNAAAGHTGKKGGRTLIKCCGLRRAEDIAMVNDAGADFAGFIMSPGFWRYTEPERVAELRKMLNSGIRAVGVFVNEPAEYVAKQINNKVIDIAQLHGAEDDEYIKRLRELTFGMAVIIKAFKIQSADDIERAVASTADYILLDSGTGTGKTFDWSFMTAIERPYFFAGGLDPDNAAEAVRRFHPFAVDVSSGIETDKVKDKNKVMAFAENVRNA